MTTGIRHHAPPTAAPSFARRAWPVAAAGMLGLLSLLLQPVPAGLLDQVPALAALPPLLQRALLLANPLLLLGVAVLVGAALAHRVGLRSVLAGTAVSAGLSRTLAGAAAGGFVLGLALAAVDAAIAPHLGQAWQQRVAAAPDGAAPLVMGLLYGGVAEEVMLRWGAMSLLAWLLLRPAGPRRLAPAMVLAMVLAAALFGAAHLPALAAEVEPNPALVARTLLLNGAAGLLYGWLFWRRHLEAAMAAHAATHLGMAAWRALTV
jgi:hypothetical protein